MPRSSWLLTPESRALGLGDEIMAAGEARRLQGCDPRPVAILDAEGLTRRHPIWAGNPRIATPEQVAGGLAVRRVVNCVGRRPHLAVVTKERYVFRPGWRAFRAEIFLSRAERSFGARRAGAVVVEPHLKAAASPNKQWGWVRWQALVTARPALDWIQVGPPGTRTLDGARLVETASFRLACAVLARARAAVLPEGGLHHAAAALGVPAVVIYGGFASPAITGYPGQRALYRPHLPEGAPCGLRVVCPGCAAAMAAIGVEEVLAALEGLP